MARLIRLKPTTTENRLPFGHACGSMPLSLRRQAAQQQQSLLKASQEKKTREKAVPLLAQGRSVRHLAHFCKMSKSTVGRLSKSIRQNDKDNLLKLLNLADNAVGRITVWKPEEAIELNIRVKYAAENGFAVDVGGMKRTLQQICADCREGNMHGVPSDATIRTYRAKNINLTYRKTKNKDAAKIKAENFDHVNSLAEHLKDVEKKDPGIFENPLHVWNIDETHVDGEFGPV